MAVSDRMEAGFGEAGGDSLGSLNESGTLSRQLGMDFLPADGVPSSRSYLRQYLQAISAGEAPGMFSEWVAARDPEVIKRVGSYFRRFQISLR